MSRFIITDRKTDYLMPPSLEDWLNQDHLARFIVEVIDGLDLSNLVRHYAGRGSKAHHPATLLAILVYGYATGTFSSRKLERATYDSVAFRYIAAGTHPDHDTLATFRRRFLRGIEALFVQVLELAGEMKVLKLGTVCLDGTKIHANASRHRALSYGHIEKLEARLKTEVQELLALAEQADKADVPDGMSLPEELKRREDRLALMGVAKAKLEARAKERYVCERTEYDQKMATRAGVDATTMLVVATGVTQATNDKQQVVPMLETLASQTATQGKLEYLIADTGYFSAHNVNACDAAQIEPLIAVARENHHPDWRERHTEPAPLPATATPAETMAHRVKTKDGRKRYALRKQSVEPVFGIMAQGHPVKSAMGFRQFSLRGLDKVRGEGSLVCLAWNLKRLAVLRPKFG